MGCVWNNAADSRNVVDLHPMIQATAVPDPVVDQIKEIAKELNELKATEIEPVSADSKRVMPMAVHLHH